MYLLNIYCSDSRKQKKPEYVVEKRKTSNICSCEQSLYCVPTFFNLDNMTLEMLL